MHPLSPARDSKKRQRYSSNSTPEPSLQAVKRRKSTLEPDRFLDHRPPRFWDTLSKVRLSRGAIREFDRRTSQAEGHGFVSPVDPLTAHPGQHIKVFARHGGPDLAHLRAFASLSRSEDTISMPSSQSRKRPSNTKSSAYDGDFEVKMIDSHIYPNNYEHPDGRSSIQPNNMNDIRQHLRQPRPSLSPSRFSEDAFRSFERQAEKAANEAAAMADVIPIIAGEGRKKYHSAKDTRFTNIALMMDHAVEPKPDVYDGAKSEQIDRRVRESLELNILPAKNLSYPAAPNFFLEGKSADGRASVARRQACWHGAHGARAMHSMQNFGAREPEYDGDSYSYSSTYHNGTGTLQLYSHHPTQPQTAGKPTEYHMNQIDAFAMTGNRETFRQGASAFRNLRALAKVHRDSFIEQANRMAQNPLLSGSSTSPTTDSTSVPTHQGIGSDTSIDELDCEQTYAKRPKRTT